jgi:hypothetical protein
MKINKPLDISLVKNTDLHKADPGIVMETAEGENSIIEEIIATDTSTIANHVVAKVCSFPLKLYCPFCCNNSSSESWLKWHIKNKHGTLLEGISVENSINSLHSCHFCHAKFYTYDLVIKHIAHHHQDIIITMLQEKGPNEYIVCCFCPYKVLNKYKIHLLAHVEEIHFTEFKTYIGQKCSRIVHSEELQYSFNVKESSMPNLNALFTRMSIMENRVSEEASLDHSEFNSSPKFSNQNIDQLLNADGNLIDKPGDIKNIVSGSELPIRRKLRFDLPEINTFEISSKENIISCSTNMKLVAKHIPKPSKVKPLSTWKSMLSFKGRKIKRNKTVSKFVTSTPNALDFQTGIRRIEYNKHISVIKHKNIAKDRLTTSINKGRCSSKKNSSADTHDTSEVLNKDMKNVISTTLHPVSLDIRKDKCYSRKLPVETLKQFECAICFDSFVKNIDLLTHTRQQHTGPLKLLQPSYKCGQCEAKFYKNSYLVKHCRFHHTP